MAEKSQVSKYFTQKDKLDLYAALKGRTEMALVVALEMFDNILGDMVEKKTAEFSALIDNLNKQLAAKELKDGETPIAGKDYPTNQQIRDQIIEMVSRIPLPTLTLEEKKSMVDHLSSKIKRPKDGITPRAGIDYPTHDQVRAYIETNKPVITQQVTKEIVTSADTQKFTSIEQRFKNLELLIRSVNRNSKGKRGGGGDSIIAGTNTTVARVGGRKQINSTATGGSGFTELTATGSIDSSNASFTFIQKPTYIVSDGAFKKENKGWTWNAGTLTATMTIPPDVDIYGVA